MRILVQLRAGGDPVIHHQEIQAFVTVLLMNGGDQHTLGINAHHLSGRQVHDGDGRLADQLFRLIIFMEDVYKRQVLTPIDRKVIRIYENLRYYKSPQNVVAQGL